MSENADIIAMLCRRIKMARIEKNLSQIELAKLSQLGIATIKRIELGESINLLTLISVLRGLGELDQLNNLLAYSEYKVNKHKKHPQRKRKTTKSDVIKNDINENEFINMQVNTMRWKY
ncbi:helix-turn-helix transcriptional regulator [Orbaceae bacterium ac157xtp]